MKAIKEDHTKVNEQSFTDIERLAHDIQNEIHNARRFHTNKRITIDIKAMGSNSDEHFSFYTVILERE